ncbi:Signal transduction histidine kinase [Actinokineospora alba]|uniref:histidine kinase n=1 Tax=Actinokineospora alba TaxID=504798 RepID=A0A1H0VD07_9PSEU|nr:nitrate- and nitrite sensing domain-containing protein [Actinokineospora alba]TDP65652.1 signal transduction histidine kinase [Actinokineospora alba]SDH67570.1 Signal transduction histidine kinase [Actinokineospora alba]SDP76422.1 Signal transduction histidine kinase [Actinokineospora alba]
MTLGILSRLGIRGRLNVLLLVPLTAVVLVAVPFVAGGVDDARSASRTADIAGRARDFGGLVWELQRERLLTAGYLASASGDNTDLVRQQRAVDTAAAAALDSLQGENTEELASALVRIGSLRELRQSALRRGVSPDAVARTYHAVIGAILDALRLVPQRTSDAEGTRQLTVLDSLLRANEENELYGMAIIATALDPTTGQVLLDKASAQARMLTERFVQQADVEHAGIVVAVDQGDVARQVAALAARLPLDPNANAGESFIFDALAAVQNHSRMRRVAQDKVTEQVTTAATDRASDAGLLAHSVGLGAALLFMLVAVLAIRVSRSISDPLRRLTDAATSVADLAETELVRVTDTEVAEVQAPRLAEIEVASDDEIGKLAVAFNRVQTTASSLVERQALTRRNVSLMFVNVAQRTQNLVGRQMALVDELERDEQDVRLLERLYRLDHVSTRLRRSADNLLVVAGTADRGRLSGPIELSTALRSALAEIEEYQRVQLGSISDVTLAADIGADLVLVFAELMENATSFSPPDTTVEVGARFQTDGTAVIEIVDHGIGLPPEKLAEENRRLVERERLDIVPTTVLGLFVVGRLARRHSLRVELDSTPGGGVTARVYIAVDSYLRRVVEPEPAHQPVVPLMPDFQIPPATPTDGFFWFPTFPGDQAQPAPEPAPPALRPAEAERGGLRRRVAGAQLAGDTPNPVPPKPATQPAQRDPEAARAAMDDFHTGFIQADARPPESRGGLNRRVAGAQLPGAPPAPPAPRQTRPVHDPDAARTALDDFHGAFARAADPPPSSARGGLSRRVPGENLAPGLRPAAFASAPPAVRAWRSRDPESERAAFDKYAMGLAKAAIVTDNVTPQETARHPGASPRRESTR